MYRGPAKLSPVTLSRNDLKRLVSGDSIEIDVNVKKDTQYQYINELVTLHICLADFGLQSIITDLSESYKKSEEQ